MPDMLPSMDLNVLSIVFAAGDALKYRHPPLVQLKGLYVNHISSRQPVLRYEDRFSVAFEIGDKLGRMPF